MSPFSSVAALTQYAARLAMGTAPPAVAAPSAAGASRVDDAALEPAAASRLAGLADGESLFSNLVSVDMASLPRGWARSR